MAAAFSTLSVEGSKLRRQSGGHTVFVFRRLILLAAGSQRQEPDVLAPGSRVRYFHAALYHSLAFVHCNTLTNDRSADLQQFGSCGRVQQNFIPAWQRDWEQK